MAANKKGASLENVHPGQEAPLKIILNYKTLRDFLQFETVFKVLLVAWIVLNILSLFLEATK